MNWRRFWHRIVGHDTAISYPPGHPEHCSCGYRIMWPPITNEQERFEAVLRRYQSGEP